MTAGLEEKAAAIVRVLAHIDDEAEETNETLREIRDALVRIAEAIETFPAPS